jgi:hypothetical protein
MFYISLREIRLYRPCNARDVYAQYQNCFKI